MAEPSRRTASQLKESYPYRKKNTNASATVIAAVITAIGGIIVAIIAGIFLLISQQNNKTLESNNQALQKTISNYGANAEILSSEINNYQATIESIVTSAEQEILSINAQHDIDLAQAKTQEYAKGFEQGQANLEQEKSKGYSQGYNEGYDAGFKESATNTTEIMTADIPTQSDTGTNMTDVCPAYQSYQYTEYSAIKSGGTDKFTMAGVPYTNGYKFRAGYTGADSSGWAVYNLNSNYTTYMGTLCHVDGEGSTSAKTVISIFFDGMLEKEYYITADMAPINFSFDVTGVGQIKIVLKAAGYDKIYYGIGNPILK